MPVVFGRDRGKLVTKQAVILLLRKTSESKGIKEKNFKCEKMYIYTNDGE
jgi:hypothetical protein